MFLSAIHFQIFFSLAGLVFYLKTAAFLSLLSNCNVDCCPTQGVNYCMLHDVEKQTTKVPVFILHSPLLETTLIPQHQFMGLIYILTPLLVNLQKSHTESYKVFGALPERKMTGRY